MLRKWDIRKDKPLVSVCTITYNHVSYIRECLDGVLGQETDFPFELIVHDDASTDGTAEIVREYAESFPHIIVSILQKENQWSSPGGVGKYIFPLVRGKYIAFCEGDDFWHNPAKLQIQVSFLEANFDYGMVHSDFNYDDRLHNKMIKNYHLYCGRRYSDDDNVAEGRLTQAYLVWTCTICARTRLFQEILEQYSEDFDNRFLMGDIQTVFHLARKAKVKYFDVSLATYRRIPCSLTAMDDQHRRLAFCKNSVACCTYLANKYDVSDQAKVGVALLNRSILRQAFRLGDNFEARAALSAMRIAGVKLGVKDRLCEAGIAWRPLGTILRFIGHVLHRIRSDGNGTE